MNKLFGIYRARVENNLDPEMTRRLQVMAPEVMGDAAVAWASACVPVGSEEQPALGSDVWLTFEGVTPTTRCG